jgi:hypothetical protein
MDKKLLSDSEGRTFKIRLQEEGVMNQEGGNNNSME